MLHGLDQSKGVGPDGISPRIPKEVATEVVGLTYIAHQGPMHSSQTYPRQHDNRVL